MTKSEIDPTILKESDLSDPKRLGVQARSITRYRRPTLQILRTPSSVGLEQTIYKPLDIIEGSMKALSKNSVDPILNPRLLSQVIKEALRDFPNYEEIIIRRREASDRLNRRVA